MDTGRPAANELGPRLTRRAPLPASVLLAVRFRAADLEAAVDNDEHGDYASDYDHDDEHHILRVDLIVKHLALVVEALQSRVALLIPVAVVALELDSRIAEGIVGAVALAATARGRIAVGIGLAMVVAVLETRTLV